MKKLVPILFVTVILTTGCPQPEPEVHSVEIGLFTPYALFPETLNGKIKEVTERNYLAIEKDGQYIKDERLTVEDRDSIPWTSDFRLTYDENGNLLLSETIDENDIQIDSRTLTVRDGRIVKSEYARDDTLRNYNRLTYGENGQLSKMEVFKMPVDTLLWKAMLSSDENGNFTEWQFYDSKDKPDGNHIFTVNQQGNRTGYKYYNAKGEKTFEQNYTYENGFLTKQEIINNEGEVFVTEYDYLIDEMGNWVKVTGFSESQVIIAERDFTYFEE